MCWWKTSEELHQQGGIGFAHLFEWHVDAHVDMSSSRRYGQCSRHRSTTRNMGTFTTSQIYIYIQLAPGKDPYHELTPWTVGPNSQLHHIWQLCELRRKLCPWTTSPSTSRPRRLHQHTLYIQDSDGLWYQRQHSTNQCFTRASPLTFETAGCTQQQLPIGATICWLGGGMMWQVQTWFARHYTGDRWYSGPQDGNEDTQNEKYQRETNGPTPNGEITLQIVLQVKCDTVIQCSTKVTHVFR